MGGSKQTEVKELAVMVWGLPSSSRVVITVTPVANSESAERNSFLSNKAIYTPSQEIAEGSFACGEAPRDKPITTPVYRPAKFGPL
jgi:hypothetical protein